MGSWQGERGENVDVPSGYSDGRAGEATIACWVGQPGSGIRLTVTETGMGDVVHSQGSDMLRESMSGMRWTTAGASVIPVRGDVEGEPAHLSTSISFSSLQISMRRRMSRMFRDRTMMRNLSLTLLRIFSCTFLGVMAAGSLNLMRLAGLEEGRHEM